MSEKEEVQQPEVVIQGPGEILKLAREKANLSCQDVADKMKLKKSLVEDIEQDNFDINLSLTFVRGYLKLYAKHVNVDEAEILSAFENLSTQKKEPAKLQSFSRRVAHQANDDKLMLVTHLIVAVVIALVVIWWFQQSSNNSTTSNVNNYPEDVTQEVIPKEDPPIENKILAGSDNLTPVSIDDSVVVTQNEEFLTDIETQTIDDQISSNQIEGDTSNFGEQADIIETTITESVEPVELIFEFSGDCWMNLADATGENIAYGVKVKGRVMPVTGIPPFVVTLGAPEVVKIRYAGELLDMSFLPSGRIAKFDLPLSE